MTQKTMTKDPKFLEALYIAGVENWDDYFTTVKEIDETVSDAIFLKNLIDAGVEKWTGFGIAVDLYKNSFAIL